MAPPTTPASAVSDARFRPRSIRPVEEVDWRITRSCRLTWWVRLSSLPPSTVPGLRYRSIPLHGPVCAGNAVLGKGVYFTSLGPKSGGAQLSVHRKLRGQLSCADCTTESLGMRTMQWNYNFPVVRWCVMLDAQLKAGTADYAVELQLRSARSTSSLPSVVTLPKVESSHVTPKDHKNHYRRVTATR